jgi:hypothetical protein
MALNLGMGSGRTKKPDDPPRFQAVEHRLDRWAGLPFAPGSTAALKDDPDRTECRVVGVGSDGDERVVEVLAGPSAGRRLIRKPKELVLLRGAEPKSDRPPRPPARNRPSGPADPSPEYLEAIRERFGTQAYGPITPTKGPMFTVEAELQPRGPNIVQGDFTPEMFEHRLPRSNIPPRVLEGGPFDGVEVRAPRAARTIEVPAANPSAMPGSRALVPAIYVRTQRANEDDLVVFAFSHYDIEEPAAAAS